MQKNTPKISIITPSYNQGNYLQETILSVINQKYSSYELIIIDGGSTDNTIEVIKKYEEYITYWVSEKDRGQSHAIRKGLAIATGDIINWINSDDLVAPGAFHCIAAEFYLDKYDVICGNCDYFLNSLNHLDLRNERMGLGTTVGNTLVEQKINQPSTFFKASVLKALGVDEQYHYAMDLELWFRYLLQAGQQRVLLSDSLFTYFRLHETSKSVAQSSRFVGDIEKVFYNVLHSLNAPRVLLDFARLNIPNADAFSPIRYPVAVSTKETSYFLLHMALLAKQHYSEIKNVVAARESLLVAQQNGHPKAPSVLRQLAKSLIPNKVLSWLASQRNKRKI
ncbi:glycosyltransferase family 2 protein [Hymenobacter sp. PAMC 26628]|uniref:glycosyltransferase family 2 protein n=1 Tax=Hymenobacter sp. PAMC 26628 TaxID=1484118 RepID=UPI00090204AD|nr:glycosyltransferase family 2 protein [Hymenobacter sp. PAMC 26628]